MDQRIAAIDWTGVARALDVDGAVHLPNLLGQAETEVLHRLLFDDRRAASADTRHGSTEVDEYSLAEPLPEPLQDLRAALYRHALPVAGRWSTALHNEQETRLLPTHEQWLDHCRTLGRHHPGCTALVVRANGQLPLRRPDAPAFPLRAAVLLSRPGIDFTGGELVLTEQRPRMQSRPSVVPAGAGTVVLMAAGARPSPQGLVAGRRVLRHAVARVRQGERRSVEMSFDLLANLASPA